VPRATDVDAAARVEAAVLAKVGDAAVRTADVAPAKAVAARAKADGDLVRVGAAHARADAGHVKVDHAEAASRRVTRRLLSRVPRVPRVAEVPQVLEVPEAGACSMNRARTLARINQLAPTGSYGVCAIW
jgi:hypothetical protein